jgi:hypothetical protein
VLGLTGGLVAGLAWDADTARRFHIAFNAGLIVLIITCVYALHAARFFGHIASGSYYPEEFSVSWCAAPVVALYGTTLGLVLIFGALCLDNSLVRADLRSHAGVVGNAGVS